MNRIVNLLGDRPEDRFALGACVVLIVVGGAIMLAKWQGWLS